MGPVDIHLYFDQKVFSFNEYTIKLVYPLIALNRSKTIIFYKCMLSIYH